MKEYDKINISIFIDDVVREIFFKNDMSKSKF